MNESEHFRLLPRGATILSGALTWLAANATLTLNNNQSIINTKYETYFRSQHAPVGALQAQRDACFGDRRAASHPQHATEAPHHGAAEPCRALSRTHPSALRPAHSGHIRLPMPPAQRRREGCKQFPTSGGRGRRHHHPP